MRPSEEAAIIEVIEAVNRTFWMRDFAAYEKLYLHSSEQLLWGYRHGGGFVIRRGWDEIAARSLDHMRMFPDPIPALAEAPLSNLRLRVVGNAAWATYDCEYPFLQEKHNGRWLIAAAGLLDPDLGEEVAVRTTRDGEILWQSAAATRRLRSDEHFVLRSGCLRARDRKLDVRLREAIGWVATDERIMPHGGSLPLCLETRAGLPRIVWVVADLDGALVFLDDIRPLRARIELAARAFGLSSAQQRLALAIAAGMDVKHYAREAGISPNTVRTHLKRMFEKVGASSQPGLVRTLLTLSPPR